MESTSADSLAQELLEHCLAGTPWPERLLAELLDGGGDRALFRIVVERLGDLFEPSLCAVYAELFSGVIARRLPDLHAEHVRARYERVRRPRVFERDAARVRDVFVLSRVTLGADVAVTSVLLDAAKQRFPSARIHFVGPQKNWELFQGDPRLSHLAIAYGRQGTLDDRLAVWPELREAVSQPFSIVIDPDSRLTQLGLLPICREDDYYFFESRACGFGTKKPLAVLAADWAEATFGAVNPRPYISTGLDAARFATTVSFGVGENPAKRIPDPFEEDLLRQLPRPLVIDRGAGGEEGRRVERVAARAGPGIEMWDGSFAGFAEHIARSRLYVGYDSAGGHVASACGVPLITVFSGYACETMLHRWSPPGARVLRPAAPNDLVREILKLSTSTS